MPRVVILGAGTGVGKTRVACALLRELSARSFPTLGLKPIESGIAESPNFSPGSDAAALAAAASCNESLQAPLYALRAPVSPHLAARAEGTTVDLNAVRIWVQQAEARVTTHAASHMALWSVVETAGGVFSPLSLNETNFDLAQALEPEIRILVAADALGVLHDVSATLQAMRARGRAVDHVVLSGAREPDASTGSNRAELEALGIATVSAVLARGDDRGMVSLVDRLLGGRDQR